MKSIVLRVFLGMGIIGICGAVSAEACVRSSWTLSPGEFMEVLSSTGTNGQVLAIQPERGALFVEIESMTHPEEPLYVERIFCDGSEPEPWLGSLRVTETHALIYLRFGSSGSWRGGPVHGASAVYRISTFQAPFCRQSRAKDEKPGEETEEEDGEIILLSDPTGSCVKTGVPRRKSEEPGEETEEEDGEIILLGSGNGEGGLCGDTEPWNELRICAQRLEVGEFFRGSLSDGGGAGLTMDVDRFAFEVSDRQDIRVRVGMEPSMSPSVHLLNGQGRVLAQGYVEEGDVRLWARLSPGRYFLRVAGHSGVYNLRLESVAR